MIEKKRERVKKINEGILSCLLISVLVSSLILTPVNFQNAVQYFTVDILTLFGLTMSTTLVEFNGIIFL